MELLLFLITLIPLVLLIVLIYCFVKVRSHNKHINYLNYRLLSLEKKLNKPQISNADILSQAETERELEPEPVMPLQDDWRTRTVTQKPTPTQGDWRDSVPKPQPEPPKGDWRKQTQQPMALSGSDENKWQRKESTPSPLWLWLQENWTGFLGVSAVVFGIAFACAYVGFFATPFIRFLMIAAFGLVFAGAGLWLRKQESWREFGACLQAGGGAIILLAFLGGGYFEGLRFYDSANIGLAMMGAGLAINLLLAYIKPQQTLSATHIVLSLLALSAAPQVLPILWAGVIICVFGLLLSHKNHWNINLAASTVAFTILSFMWQQNNPTELYMHGIIATIIVFVPGLLAHYRHVYQGADIIATANTHLIAWVLFGVNLLMYQQGNQWIAAPIALGAVAALGMGLYAKRKGIEWLFIMDFLVGELLTVFAVMALYRYDIEIYMLCFAASIATALFLILSMYQGWRTITRVNVGLSIVAVSLFVMQSIQFWIPNVDFAVLAACLIGIYYVGYHLLAKAKNMTVAEFYGPGGLFFNIAMLVLGSFIIFASLFYEFRYIFWVAAIVASLMLFNPRLNKNGQHKKSIFAFMLFTATYSWLFVHHQLQAIVHAKEIIMLYWGMVMLPVGLMLLVPLKGNLMFSEYKNRWYVDYALYVFGIHLGVIIFWLVRDINAFLPAISALIVSVVLMEIVGKVNNNMSDKTKTAAQAGKNIGLCALGLFLLCYSIDVIHSQATIFTLFSIRTVLAILGVVVAWGWLYNRQFRGVTLGFDFGVILLVMLLVLELDTPMHGIAYSALGIALLVLPKLTQMFPPRKYLYSVGLLFATLIHVPIVSSTWASPLSNWYQVSHVTGIVALVVASILATLLSRQDFTQDKSAQSGWLQRFNRMYHIDMPLLTYLPIFISLAAFLYWRFDGAFLTALWVGEVFVMLLLGILIKRQSLARAAYAFLIICLIRLLLNDFAQSDMLTKAIVFVAVGLMMIAMHVTYKKLKGRFE